VSFIDEPPVRRSGDDDPAVQIPGAFPGAPRVEHGSLLVYRNEDASATPEEIPFQYNPDELRRSLSARTAPRTGGGHDSGGAREDSLRVPGPPVETITLTIELNAVDLIDDQRKGSLVASDGLNGALATLELMLYPSSHLLKNDQQLASKGAVQIRPAEVPITVLVFGSSRVVPVLISGFSITETQFDTRLRPILAKADLTLRVLSYMDLRPNTIGRKTYIAYQQEKERLAGTGWSSSISAQPMAGQPRPGAGP
jgi:hypothetical protein